MGFDDSLRQARAQVEAGRAALRLAAKEAEDRAASLHRLRIVADNRARQIAFEAAQRTAQIEPLRMAGRRLDQSRPQEGP